MKNMPIRPERLVRARVEAKMSITQVSRALGITYSRWWHVEHGKSKVTQTLVDRFSAVVGIPVETIKAMPGSYPKTPCA